MKIRSFGLSDVGKKREKNEDSFLISDDLSLFVVADGMGGHLGGDIASRIAVNTIYEMMKELDRDPEMTADELGLPLKPGDIQGYLKYAIKIASNNVFEKASTAPSLRGMGTTAVCVLFKNNKAYIANVGDSRAYRMRAGKIDQITKDHSLVGEQIRAGMLSEEDARVHKLKNIITKSVGFQEEVDADVDIRVARAGDKFLLCTDGLNNMVKSEDILDIVAVNDVKAACERLVDMANERGGDDNITVVISEVEELDPEPNVDEDTTIEA